MCEAHVGYACEVRTRTAPGGARVSCAYTLRIHGWRQGISHAFVAH